jgi:hypothetical protein
MSIGAVFLESAIKRLAYYKELADKTFTQLTEADYHFQPNETSNSIAIIIQHMAGNMLSRWTNFLTSDGEKEWRKRDDEFEEQQMTLQQLNDLWEQGWQCCLKALIALTEEDILKTIHIRGEGLLVVDAVNRQLAHYPYHVGQIIYIAKIIRDSQWKNLSIVKGGSLPFNEQMKKKG